jgi:glycosyltransferase involved in cell wall biosynthesis
MAKTMQGRTADPLTVYQAKFQTYLLWSQPFLYRLFESLQPEVRQIVLTQRVEHADLFPMPVIRRLDPRIFYSPYHAHVGACELQQRYQGDLIHAHFGFTAYKLMLLKVFMRIPMVATFGGTDLTVHAARPKTGALYRVLFDLLEQLVAVSEDLRQSALQLGCPPEKIVTIHRGVDTEAFPFVDRGSREEKSLEILMVSRLSKKKGHLEALAALAGLPEEVAEWRLSIVGSGPEEAAIRTQVRERGLEGKVDFKGNLPIEDVRQLMAESDILLHPSLTPEDGDREGIPNAVMEGQATGLPVVSTRHGGIPELVLDGETGLLVGERQTEALSEALRQLLASKERRLRMGAAGRERIVSEFSLEQQARRYLEIYHELSGRFSRDGTALEKIQITAPVPAMLRASESEIIADGTYSLSEVLEHRFVDRSLESEQPDPWWYHGYWRLKEHLPLALRSTVKTLLQRGVDVFPRKARERDDALWAAIQGSVVPDPFEPPRRRRELFRSR